MSPQCFFYYCVNCIYISTTWYVTCRLGFVTYCCIYCKKLKGWGKVKSICWWILIETCLIICECVELKVGHLWTNLLHPELVKRRTTCTVRFRGWAEVLGQDWTPTPYFSVCLSAHRQQPRSKPPSLHTLFSGEPAEIQPFNTLLSYVPSVSSELAAAEISPSARI